MTSISRTSPTNEAAVLAENEATRRIQRAQEVAKEAEFESQDQQEATRQQFHTESERQRQNYESQLENEKNKGYDSIAKTQRTFKKQQQALETQGKIGVQKTANYYDQKISETAKEGYEKLRKTKTSNVLEQDLETSKAKTNIDLMKIQNRSHQEILLKENEQKIQDIVANSQKILQGLRSHSDQELRRSYETHLGHLKNTFEEQLRTLNKINTVSSDKLRSIQEEHAQKLERYGTMKSDPFYQLIQVQTELKDEPNQYLLFVRVPEYEQGGISINIRDREIVISGRRNNNETRQVPEENRSQTVASYQAYNEVRTVAHPVDPKLVLRENHPDGVLFILPKLGLNVKDPFVANNRGKTSSPERVSPPHFPLNLTDLKGLPKES